MDENISIQDSADRIAAELVRIRTAAFKMDDSNPAKSRALMTLANVMVVISSQMVIMMNENI